METTKLNNLVARIVGFLGCLMLTIFAGFFGFSCIGALVMSAIEGDFITTAISAVCGFLAWCCWSIRKAPLV